MDVPSAVNYGIATLVLAFALAIYTKLVIQPVLRRFA